jgi:hypothetical protein
VEESGGVGRTVGRRPDGRASHPLTLVSPRPEHGLEGRIPGVAWRLWLS